MVNCNSDSIESSTMRKLSFLIILATAFLLSACFRSVGDTTPTVQPFSTAQQVSVDTTLPTQEVAEANTPEAATTVPTTVPTTQVAVQASATSTATFTPTITTTPVGIPLGQGGQGDAMPLGEGISQIGQQVVVVVASPTFTSTFTAIPPTNTATATPTFTSTATPTNAATSTVTPIPSNTPDLQETIEVAIAQTLAAQPTATPIPNNVSGPRATWTTVPLDYNQNINLVSQSGQGGQAAPTEEVAQIPTATPQSGTGPTVNQLTATAIFGIATSTAAAQQTIAAGGQPGVVQPPGATAIPTIQQGGQQVVVVTSTPIGSDCEYLVALGDTLSEIARAYNLTINDLAVRNNITNPDLIQAGYPILIPNCGGTASSATAVPTLATGAGGQVITPVPGSNAQGPFQYTVVTGDRIYQLSVRYGVTVSAILASNPQITNMNVIFEGQVITIPGPPTTTPQGQTLATPVPGSVIIVTATPQGAAPQVIQPTIAQPVFTPTFTVPAPQG
jgi:LysM repeat protein